MAEFPESLQQYAIPRAGDNKAGQKLQQPAPQTAAKPIKKKAAVAQAKQALERMSSKPDIHQSISQVSGGAIKHGKDSPYVTGEVMPRPSDPAIAGDTGFDPFASTPDDGRSVDPIRLQAMKNAALHEMGVDSDDDIPLNLPKSLPPRFREESNVANIVGPVDLKVAKYLDKSTRVMLEVSDGTFTLPVIDVKESRLSMLLLLPLRDNATIFIPKPGTQLFLTHNGVTTKVYYPGTYAEVPELNTGFMSLIKADAETEVKP